VLVKGDGGWRMSKPVDAPADEITVKNLINAIADAEVEENDRRAAVGPQQVRSGAAVRDGEAHAKDKPLPDLKVGNTTAVSFSTYVQRADQPRSI
jgi:hypothetical protein